MAVLLVLALWTNSHGSFMLGFLLIGLKLFQEVLERFAGWDETSGPAGLGWLITLLLSLVVMAFANPYGPENLLVPFRQLFETTVTSQWVDWRPLIHEETLFTRGFFKPLSVLPFLGLVTLTMLLPMILLATKEGRGKLHALLSTTAASHLRMEVLMALLLAPLVLKFQRMIIFATPALVPLLAASAQCYAELISERSHVLAGFRESRAGVAMRTALASVVLLLIATVFYKSIVLRYAPGNPLNYDKSETPLTQRLMSPNFMRTDAVEFMKKNGIRGRVFTNIYLSNYLLFYVPDIKLFLDLRAQSVFPPRIIRDYLEIVDPEPLDPTKGVNLLETFKVSFAVLDTSSSATSLAANKLMETRRWGCIYSDSWGVILASVDEERFGPLVVTADLEGLWYSRPETRVASQALLEFFMKGTIRPELFERLIKVQRQIEDPNMYSLIVETMNSGSECLNSRTKIYLESEIARLSAADHLVTGGAFSTLRSLLRLLELLERNELLCEGPRLSGKYTLSKRRFSDLLDDIKARYGGL
ncbi:MAG: hypothetical protein FJY85_07890 [Deltaproteobacteria bacterium]|nr:hypothetical protein [Deltaproteobacteria bacterium]